MTVDRAVAVIVVMAVIVTMPVVVVSLAVTMRGRTDLLAGAGAFGLAQLTALHQPLDVVVMTVLRGSHLLFEAQHLSAVFAERTVHVRVAA